MRAALALALDAIERIASVSEVLIVVGHAREKIESFVAAIASSFMILLVGPLTAAPPM